MNNIGQHEAFSENLGIEYTIINSKYKTLQFFLGPKLKYTRTRKIGNLGNAVKIAKENGVKVFSHAPYLWNFCGSVKELAWNGNEGMDRKTKSMISEVEYELSVLARFAKEGLGGGVVVHPGTFKREKECLDTIIKTINEIKFPEHSMLLLENCAGKGTTQPRTLEQMRYLIKGVNKKENVGICLDTAHLFGVGEYDIRKKEEIDRLYSNFEKYIGLEYLKLIHLNDSKAEFGSCKDLHEHPGDGLIWKDNKEVLTYFLNKFKDYPMIVEVANVNVNSFV